jgi:hypothetical protein
MPFTKLSYFGFIMAFSGLCVAIAEAKLPVSVTYVPPIFATVGILLIEWRGSRKSRLKELFNATLLIAALSTLPLTLEEVAADPLPDQTIPIVFLSVILAILFRLSYWWWFCALIVVLVWSLAIHPGIYGLIFSIPIFLLVLATNFAFKMFVDNWPNMRSAWLLAEAKRKSITGREVAKLVWPIIVLAAIGIIANIAIQRAIVNYSYDSGLVLRQATTPRNLEGDIDYTIDERTKVASSEIIAKGVSTRTAVDSVTSDTARRFMRIFGALEPTPYDVEKVCKNFVGSTSRSRSILERAGGLFSRGSKQTFQVDLRGQCKEAFTEISNQGADAWRTSKDTITGEVYASRDDFNAAVFRKHLGAENFALAELADASAKARTGMHYIFDALRALAWWSWITLFCAVVAVCVQVLARLLFDNERASFQLAPKLQEGMGPLKVHQHDKLQLNLVAEFQHPGSSTEPVRSAPKRWFVTFDAARYGNGTQMNTDWYRLRPAFFRRLVKNRLLFTQVDVDPGAVDPPVISAQGDVSLLDIYLERDRELVFRLEDLIAFSDGMILRSCFSMNVATEIFGLGSFYTTAKGEGRIVLRTEGHEHVLASECRQFPSGIMLAWDHSARFTLAQSLNLRGVWGNAPSLVLQSDGKAILDEGRPGDPDLLRRIWQLLRFVVLPI